MNSLPRLYLFLRICLVGICCLASPLGAVSLRLMSSQNVRQLQISGPELQLKGGASPSSSLELRWQSPRQIAIEAPGFRVSGGLWEIHSPGPLRLLAEGKSVELASAKLRITPEAQGLKIVATLPLEAYVAQVLAAEIPAESPPEALEAMAVAIRSYALATRGRHAGEGFDFCDLTHCQAFGPRPGRARPKHRELLVDAEGRIALTLYHASCGGETSSNATVFGGAARPYLKAHPDPYCAASPHAHWESRLPRRAFQESFAELMPGLEGLRGERRQGKAGRWLSVALLGAQGAKILNAQEFWLRFGRHWGWQGLKSTWFEIEDAGDELIFRGRGLGHGVGLCQWGVIEMARRGHSYREILDFYFPGTRRKALGPDF